jgi:Cu2+-exporting ATPase
MNALTAQSLAAEKLAHLDAAVEGMHCLGCVRKLEKAMADVPGLITARVNLTNKRLSADFDASLISIDDILARVDAQGFKAIALGTDHIAIDRESRHLVRALAVAGFAAGNVMIYSVAVWAGLAQDMDPITRRIFQWIAGGIAVPAVAYAGMPFYIGAWRALSHYRMNMDVPIALALILTCVSSVIEMVRGAPHVYFDGAATLTFILLIGRVLDHNARARARAEGAALLALQSVTAYVLDELGHETPLPARSLIAGQQVRVKAGDRIPADGHVLSGWSDVDLSLVTGETLPLTVKTGDKVFAGAINLSGPLTVQVDAAGPDTLLAEIDRLMVNAAQSKTAFVTFADKAIAIYAPMVHVLALATLIGWLTLSDVVWQQALITAVTVLIITCPCALGLAVPISHVVAAGRLFAHGILLKTGDALERLAAVDYVVFDKTGTLTVTDPALVTPLPDPAALSAALALARQSRHPLCTALQRAAPNGEALSLTDMTEYPGRGVEGYCDGRRYLLGSADFVGAMRDQADDGLSEFWLVGDATDHAPQILVRFGFTAPLRRDAGHVVSQLKQMGLDMEILSGDRPSAVERIAGRLNISSTGGLQPGDKLQRLEQLARADRLVLMVGDGINDAPALSGAHISMAPSSAAEISQNVANVVFTGVFLQPIADAIRIARRTDVIVRQNIMISLAYNLLAVPLAVMGHVTPLIAAIAMSASSLTVVLNALRLRRA